MSIMTKELSNKVERRRKKDMNVSVSITKPSKLGDNKVSFSNRGINILFK